MTYSNAKELKPNDEVILKGTNEVCKVNKIQIFRKYKLVMVTLKTYSSYIEVCNKDIIGY
jgi:hypothetical protein